MSSLNFDQLRKLLYIHRLITYDMIKKTSWSKPTTIIAVGIAEEREKSLVAGKWGRKNR